MEFILPLLLGAGLLALLFGNSDDDTPEEEVEPTFGTEGDDTVTLSDGPDEYYGGAGNDSIDGALGFDTLSGDEGDDVILGGGGQDELFGGAGFDKLSGNAWHDTLNGGGGFDDLDGGSGDDTLYGGLGKDLLEGGTGNDNLSGDNWHDGLFGGDGNDDMSGGTGDDLLEGGAGNDMLMGDDGDDGLFGGDGNDVLEGGAGDDILMGSVLFNRPLTPEDYDDVRDDRLPVDEDGEEYIENWGLSGTDTETGVDPSNTLFGGDGDDVLFLGNADIGTGGAGMDEFVLGDWFTDEQYARITDFNSTEDVIVILLEDGNLGAEISTLSVEGDEIIFINGMPVAQVSGTFDALDGIEANILTTSYTAAA